MCDGTTPGSPVLADGHTLYTPGLSENRGGTSIFYDFDRIGNLWTADGTTKNQLGYIDFYSFGGAFAAAGTTTPFGFGGANGCQTEADTGLMLMRYRYYDSRIGRFISQDPIGDGNNWYAYADNNPVNETDPRGLQAQDGPPGTLPGYDPNDPSTNIFNPDTAPQIVVKVLASTWSVPSAWNGFGMGGGMGPGLGGGASLGMLLPGPKGTTYRMHIGEQPTPDMHIYHNNGETNIDNKGKLRTGPHRGSELKELPKKLKSGYRPIIKTFLERAGVAADAIEEVLDGLTLDIPIVGYYDPTSLYHRESNGVDITPRG